MLGKHALAVQGLMGAGLSSSHFPSLPPDIQVVFLITQVALQIPCHATADCLN